ncbi:MAG: hypothetical protein IPK74_02470 [Deltaproteobacteria bacterium]|nr:hypothetical protein [Deltaproteobacteria bacterium]
MTRSTRGVQGRTVLGFAIAAMAACGDDARGGQGGSASNSAGDGIGTLSATGTDGASGNVDDGGDDDVKLDAQAIGDLGLEGCGGDSHGGGGGGTGGDGDLDFSYIWIANSGEGTMSKINTRTMVEEGRYVVRPDQAGNPSRTSVNLSGDVAIANRAGGLTKVAATAERCVDVNGDGMITTANGAAYLPWGQDECVLWHVPYQTESQRPVAWAPGTWNAQTCAYDNEDVWTATGSSAAGIDVYLHDGDTGTQLGMAHIGEMTFDGYGIYGGAVDGEGNFWGTMLGGILLTRVDKLTFDHQVWPVPISSYGMTVDSDGFVWACSFDVARFDPESQTWQTAMGVGGSGGCMGDGAGKIWLASDPLVAVDTTTLAVVDTIDIPSYAHGVSVDFDGYVWGVTLQEPYAYKADPTSHMVQTFSGLTLPYTYSDMTGFALKNAGTIPTPAG